MKNDRNFPVLIVLIIKLYQLSAHRAPVKSRNSKNIFESFLVGKKQYWYATRRSWQIYYMSLKRTTSDKSIISMIAKQNYAFS